ncbi:hypothetical protein WA026_018365 [Henosepilachna vigintioctopunctata]|uniref:Uncharacterized protein n=1 Tax=Henosepilachna vigintioctopunctata TaxID=420089 RepID=A0AAW1VAF4_9CUCU
MIKLLLLIQLLCSAVNGANILAFFHNPAISHQFVFRSIVKELSLRGHSVTFVTSDPMKDAALTNITEVDISASYQIFKNLDASIFSREATNLIKMGILGLDFTQNLFKIQMEVEGVKEILKKPKDTYDLVLIEVGNPIYNGLKYKFKAPLIAISSYGIPSYWHELLGNPTHPFLYVDIFSKYLDPLESIWGKIDSLYIYLVNFFLGEFLIFPSTDKLARSYFGNDMPYIKDLVRDTSLTIANVNPIISDRRPLAPNVVEVWNLHLNRVEPSQKVSIYAGVKLATKYQQRIVPKGVTRLKICI